MTTTNTRFPICLKFVIQAEGGYSNDPGDPGGATMHGITHKDYDAYRKAKGEAVQDVRKISDAEVADIYISRYWAVMKCDTIPAPLDLVVFDCAVNQGVGMAWKTLNRVLGISPPMARSAPDTESKIMAIKDAKAAASQFVGLRESFYKDLAARRPTMQKFLHGWLNRMASLRHAAGI
jgi:lysozyme family protein